ncbi:hypothetical protein ACSDQ9_06225 [Aestuariimicrobium soli]|uniref:hypothetical protein n=1 Tax=Aestuariimicrobium soli TaxID=2035834 RepID=UPI003EC11EB6
MSGYILCVIDDDRVENLQSIFRADETQTLPLSSGRTLLYVSNSGLLNAEGLFQGYAIDHTGESMIFGLAGPRSTPDPSRPLEGSYLVARVESSAVRVSTDVFGFVPMMWTQGPNFVAASDSFLSLVTLRRVLGLSCSPDEVTIRGRMWLNSMSLQQLGTDTYCAEIKYVTPGTELRIDADDCSVQLAPLDLVAHYSGSFASHEEAVTESASRMVRVMRTYAEAGGLISLGLSGGTDSRLCLAAGLAADVGDALHVASKNNGTPDYQVALDLSERFGFPLNRTDARLRGDVSPIDHAATWAGTSLGLYDATYTPPAVSRRSVPYFSVGGQGAEISKGNFGWRPLSSINMPAEGQEQCRRALRLIGADEDDRWGSEWHYLAFRNAIHGGRAGLSSEYISRPAAQVPLIGLSRSPLNDLPAPRKAGKSIILDTLIKLSPQLATVPFDDHRKDVGDDYVGERLAKLGGQLDARALSSYRREGTPRLGHGVIGTQIDLARRAGFTGGLAPRDLMPSVSRSLAVFDGLVSPQVREALESIDPMSTTRLGAASRPAGAMGKLVGIGVLA